MKTLSSVLCAIALLQLQRVESFYLPQYAMVPSYAIVPVQVPPCQYNGCQRVPNAPANDYAREIGELKRANLDLNDKLDELIAKSELSNAFLRREVDLLEDVFLEIFGSEESETDSQETILDNESNKSQNESSNEYDMEDNEIPLGSLEEAYESNKVVDYKEPKKISGFQRKIYQSQNYV